MDKILIFGYGYTAKYVAELLLSEGYIVYGTSRNQHNLNNDITNRLFIVDYNSPCLKDLIAEVSAILICVPPNHQYIDSVFHDFSQNIIANKSNIKWLGYLSSTNVYGDYDGDWVDETSACTNQSIQSQLRLQAEDKWLDLYRIHSIATHIFRLSGIYGPNNSALDKIKAGKNYSVFKPKQLFSRIHVKDIANAILQSINKPTPGEIFNLCDDMPSASHEVEAYAAKLLNLPPLKIVPFEQANLSPMALEFYKNNKKVSNKKIKQMLNLQLLYANYISGLESLI